MAVENNMRVFVLFMFIGETFAGHYSWYFYPIADHALYGYDQAANKSFRSERIPVGVRTQVEDGIQALFVPPGVEVDLGEFADTCISDPNVCKRFTVSFLFKTWANKTQEVLDSGVKDGRTVEYGWSFKISSYSGDVEAMVSDGDRQTCGEKLAATDSWIQMAFTFDVNSEFPKIALYQNGSHALAPSVSLSNVVALQDRNTRLKLGSKSNRKGFFISNLNFTGVKLSVDEIRVYGNKSFKEAMEAKNVTVEILESQVITQAQAGMAVIRMRRQGFPAVATAVNYDTKSLTAEPGKHFKAATGKQLAFAPGEIYKEVKIGIINTDNMIEGNRTFQVIFSSPQAYITLKGPMQVNITVVYTKGSVLSKGAMTDGSLLHCLFSALMNLIGTSFLVR